MNGKTSTAQIFDPAAAGWTLIERTGFGDVAGPLWRKGDAAFGFVAARKHLNLNDVVHGGMIATLVDQAMGMTAMRANNNKRHATIELSVQFIGAVRLGEFVEAHCEVVRLTRSIIFMRSKAVVDERPVAIASGVWKILGEA
jgi:uncharacterized protein (TIGR00369 family)